MKLTRIITVFCALVFLSSCAGRKTLTVTVYNNSDTPRSGEMVSLPSDSVLARLGTPCCIVTDAGGNAVPSQITYDGRLIFQTSVLPGDSMVYKVVGTKVTPAYEPVACGRVYPERHDDLAWENDLVGFRAYGPETQRRGERAFGYDIFFKHPSPEPMLEKLYGPETSPATWAKADSLRKIDPKLAEEFINSISYHIDHGLGMDCYAVGPTLGDGVAAIVMNDSLAFPWCYDTVQVLDNGPLRFTARLDFAPRAIGPDREVAEHRIISLDAGQRLNRARVWWDGLSAPRRVAAGFPLRDDSPAILSEDCGIVTYADPTQGPDNGKAQLGLIFPSTEMGQKEGHILAYTTVEPGDTLGYSFGFSWDRVDFPTLSDWHNHLRTTATQTPLQIKWQ